MKIKGSAEVINKLRLVAVQQPKRVASALFLRGQMIMIEAKRRCPADGGILRGSGEVHPPEITADNISVLLSFGGAASAYALAVHEHLSEYSPYSWRIAEERGDGIHWTQPGTGPKYLEGPLNEARNDLDRWLAARLHLDKP